MADCRRLRRLALAIEERAAEAVVAFVANGGTGIPEFRGAYLVGDILDLGADLAVLDFVEELAAELGVEALLVDRERAVANDVDAVLDILDHIGDAQLGLAGLKADIGHALELHAAPGVGIAAAIRLLLAKNMHLVADRLIIDELAVANKVPFLCRHTFIVIADIAKAADFGLVRRQIDLVAAVLEAGLALVERGKAGASIIGFVAEHSIEFERVADRFMDRQPCVRRIEDEIIFAGLDRGRRQLRPRLLGGGDGILLHVVALAIVDDAVGRHELVGGIAIEIFEAAPGGRRQL